MTTSFANTIFKATGSTTPRTSGERAAEVINVKDYGAVGDAVTNDTAAIQAAIDAAFGTAASPHGYANRALNKKLYFPPSSGGAYLTHDSLVFTHVYGGLIYADNTSIVRSGGTAAAPTIVIDGMVGSRIENISMYSDNVSPCNLDIDWNGTWTDLPVANTNGLRHNVFTNCFMGTAQLGIRVAHSGNDGSFNTFSNITVGNTGVGGIDLQGANAIGNVAISSSTTCGLTGQIGLIMSAGQFSIIESCGNGGNSIDISVASNYPVTILGGRCETNAQYLNVSAGLVRVKGFNIQDPFTKLANITGGKVIFDGCFANAGSTGITGNGGSLYIRGCDFPAGFHSAYTGTVAQEI